MHIREELHEALDQQDFPSQALLAQTLTRLDEPARGRRYAWPAPVAAGLISIALVVTLVIVHINGQSPALTDNRPDMQVSSTVTGLVSYQWVSAQVAWVNLSAPDGGTMIARTVDGGRTWHRELSLSGLRTTPTAQFFNDREVVVIGEPVATATDMPLLNVWRTSDGGANWQVYPMVVDRTELPDVGAGNWVVRSSYFLDDQRGWVLLYASYMCGGCRVQNNSTLVFQTTDGGAKWSKSATLPYQLGGWLGIKFASPTTGLVWDYRGQLDVTHDGGKSWSGATVSVPGDPLYPNYVLPEPVTFLSANEALYALDLAKAVTVPCLDTSGHNEPLAGNVPPYCQNPRRAVEAVARYVFSSDDGGLTWARSPAIPFKGEMPLSGIPQPRIEFIDRHHWVVLDSDGVTQSTDGGATWSPPRSIPTPAGWYLNEGQFLDASHGWVTVSDSAQATFTTAQKANLNPVTTWPKFAMLTTSDGGATWHEITLPQA
jgi:photosystem II stability/assembly factor-like uncharacterized protein